MKETIFDVLMYLFDNYIEEDVDTLPDADLVKDELLQAGFEHFEVNKAFDWLESLTNNDTIQRYVSPSFRVFTKHECERLDIECQNLLLFLEHNDILSATNREIVIDRAMALDDEDLSLEKLKWIILMVLFSQPDEHIAFSRMEEFVYCDAPFAIH